MKIKLFKNITAWLLSIFMIMEMCQIPSYAMEGDNVMRGQDISSDFDISSNEDGTTGEDISMINTDYLITDKDVSENDVSCNTPDISVEKTQEKLPVVMVGSNAGITVKDITDTDVTLIINENGVVTYTDNNETEEITGKLQLTGAGGNLNVSNNSSSAYELKIKDASFKYSINIAGIGEVIFHFEGITTFERYANSNNDCIFNIESVLTANANEDAIINVSFADNYVGGNIFKGNNLSINGGTWNIEQGNLSVFNLSKLNINGGVLELNKYSYQVNDIPMFECQTEMTDGIVNLGSGITMLEAVGDSATYHIIGGSFNVNSINEMDSRNCYIVQDGGSVFGYNARLLRLMGVNDKTRVDFFDTFAYTTDEYIGILPEEELPETIMIGEETYTKISSEGIATNNSTVFIYANLNRFDEIVDIIDNPTVDLTAGSIVMGETNGSLFYIQNENYVLYSGEITLEGNVSSNTIAITSGTLEFNLNASIIFGKENKYLNSITALSVDNGANVTVTLYTEKDTFYNYFTYDYNYVGMEGCVPAPSVTIAENASLSLINNGDGGVCIGARMLPSDVTDDYVAIVNKGELTLKGGIFEINSCGKSIYNVGKKSTVIQEGVLAGTLNIIDCLLTATASITSNHGAYMQYSIKGGDIYIDNSTLYTYTRGSGVPEVALGYGSVAGGTIIIKDSVIYTEEYSTMSPSSIAIIGSSQKNGPYGTVKYDIKDSTIVADGMIISNYYSYTDDSDSNIITGNNLILSTNDLTSSQYIKWKGTGLFMQTNFDDNAFIRYIVNDAVKVGDSVLNLTLPADVTIDSSLELTIPEKCYLTIAKDYYMTNEGIVFVDGWLNANTPRLGVYEDNGITMYSLQSPGITLHSKTDDLTGELSISEVIIKYNGKDINAKKEIDYTSSYDDKKGIITITPTTGSSLIYGNPKGYALELPKTEIENVAATAIGVYEEGSKLAEVMLSVNNDKCEAYFKNTSIEIENGKKPGYDCYIKVKDEYAGDYTLENHEDYVESENAVLVTVPVSIHVVRELGQVMAGVEGQVIELNLSDLGKVFSSVDGETYSIDEIKEVSSEIKSRLMTQGKLTIETDMVTSNNYLSVYLTAHHIERLDTELELRIPIVESISVVYEDFSTKKTVHVFKNTYLEKPTIPVKEGYVFNGWYINSAYMEDVERKIMDGSNFIEELEGTYVEWNFDTDKVTDFGFTLYAHWLKIEIVDLPSIADILRSGRPVSEVKFIESTLNAYCDYSFENPDEMPQSYSVPQVLIISVKEEYENKITLKGNLGYHSENNKVYKNIYVPFYRRIDTDGIEVSNSDKDGAGLYTVTVNITKLKPFEKGDETTPEYTVMGTDIEVENLHYIKETQDIVYDIYRNSEEEQKEVVVYLKAEGQDETKTVYIEFPVMVEDGYVVTYNSNYEGSYAVDITYEKNATIRKIYEPTRQDYYLQGWFIKQSDADAMGIIDENAVAVTGERLFGNNDEEFYIKWKFDTYILTGNANFYAKWQESIEIPEVNVVEKYAYGISLKDVSLNNLSDYCDYHFLDESINPVPGFKAGYAVKISLKDEYKDIYTISQNQGYDESLDAVIKNVYIPMYVEKNSGCIFTNEQTSEFTIYLDEIKPFGSNVNDAAITYEYLYAECDYNIITTSVNDINKSFKVVFGNVGKAMKNMAIFRFIAHTEGYEDVNVYLTVDSVDGHSVTYNYLDYLTKDTIKMYEANKPIPVSDTPIREGFVFAGWYISEETADKLQVDKNVVVPSDMLFDIAATIGYSASGNEQQVINYEKDPYPQGKLYYVLWDFEENLLTDDIELYARWEYPMEDGSDIFVTEVRDINYTGSKLYPEVIVRDKYTGKVLTEGVDYKLSYKNNVRASHAYVYNENGSIKDVVELDRILQRVNGSLVYDEDGTPTVDKTKEPNVIVTGIGNYSRDKKAIVRVPFRILPASLADVTYTYKDLVYVTTKKTGQKVTLTAKYEGKSVKMGINSDYTVMYRKDGSEELLNTIPAKESGLYYICIIAAKGLNFDGSIELPVMVYDNAEYTLMSTATISLTNEAKKVSYTGESIEFTEIVEGIEQVKKNAKGKDYITVTAKVGTLNSKGKVVYTTQTLTYGTDYVLSYENNVDIGKATLIVKAADKSRFVGNKSINFTITGTSIKKTSVSGFVNTFTYTGDEIMQNASLSYKGIPLTEQDYNIEYLNSKNKVMNSYPTEKGTYYLRFTGKRNFTGTFKKKFSIQAVSLAGNVTDSIVSLNNGGKIIIGEVKNTVFNKSGAIPVVELTYRSPEGKELTLYDGIDYKLTYKNNKRVINNKSPQIIVKGKGNFKGNISPIDFTIEAKELSGYTINAQATDMIYNAKKKDEYLYQPKIVLYDGNKKLKNKKDYSYTISGNDQISVAKQIEEKGYAEILVKIISGSGTDYIEGTDPFIITCRIGKASIASANVRIASQSFNGFDIELEKDDFVKVKLKGKDLTYGVDFVIKEGSYQNNINVGKASVVIIGTGPNYVGEKKVVFKIIPKVIKK